MRSLFGSIAVLLLFGLPPFGSLAWSQSLMVGMAEAEITPPLGFPIAGYYHERLADGTRDPLKAKAVVFRDGDQSAALVVADLTGISRDLCVEVRRKAAAAIGIDEANLVIAATHSHTAPDYTRHLYDFLGEDPRDGEAYPAKLINGLVDAVKRASESVSAVDVTAGSATQQTPVSFNRRFVMKDGSVRTWQAMSNPEVVRAAGPIDPEIGLLMFRASGQEKPLGVISSFALHLDTVGGKHWSADYPYYIEQRVRKLCGDDVISLFALGTCGDINHSDPNRKERNKTDFIGNSLADTVESKLPHLDRVVSPHLQVRTETVMLPLQTTTSQQLERARQLIPAAVAGEKVDFFDLVSAHKAVTLDQLRHKRSDSDSPSVMGRRLSRTWDGVGDALPVEVTTVTLGADVALVFLPGEIFVDLGLAIKRGSPYRTTLVIELAGCVETMYVPTRTAYAGGGYEVINSAVEPGSGEMLVEVALKQLRESATALPAG